MKKIAALTILLTVFAGSVFGQHSIASLTTALNHRIVEVKSFDDTDTSEFSAFKIRLSAGKVIGLGEAFHSAKLPTIGNQGQFEFVLNGLKYANFFLDLAVARSDKTLAAYLKQPLLTRAVGAGVVNSEKDILLPIRVAEAYDGILFFRGTTAAAEIRF